MKYDVVIVGSGSAASGVAKRARAAGRSVALVDFRPFGGTCALRGCDPKKVLVARAKTVDRARRMRRSGVEGEVRIDWPAMMTAKRGFTDPVPEKREARLRDQGVDALHGHARFVGPDRIDVDGRTIEGARFVLAVGAEPVELGIPGARHLVTHERFLELESPPRRIVLVGGGYIAAEFSHVAARAGSQVTVLQRGERMLTHFDPDLVDLLMNRFRSVGIDVRTGTEVEAVEETANGYSVRASAGGRQIAFEADLVVHAAGRRPDFAALDLDRANVRLKDGGLELNDYLQSVSNPAVYAAGDAARKGPPLTPVAAYDARIVAANILDGNSSKPDYTGVPSVAFTVPPIAAVGLAEAEARERNLRFRTGYADASEWFTANHESESVYGYKVLIEEGTERILGAHLVGPHVDEVINLFALAVRNGLSAEDLKGTLFAYPTGASDITYMLGD